MAPIKSTGAAFTRGRQKRLATVYPKQDLQVPCLPSLWSTLGSWWLQDPGGGQGTAGAGGVREGFPNFSCYIFHEPLPLYFWLSYLCYLDILLLSLALPLSGYCRHTDFRPSHCPNFPPICCVLILSCPSGRLFSLIPRTCAQPGIHLFSLLPWFCFMFPREYFLHLFHMTGPSDCLPERAVLLWGRFPWGYQLLFLAVYTAGWGAHRGRPAVYFSG